jgi:large subunit ribosomal protein L22
MNKTTTYNKEHMARVSGKALSISTKYSIEISSLIRNKKLDESKEILQAAIELKKAIPIKKFKGNIPHKTKIGPGKFPVKACKEILSLLNTVEANAQFKGLNTSELIISKIVANKASNQWHHGRQKRRRMKRTNMEIIVEESKKKDKETKKEVKKDVPKKEEVKTIKKVEEKKPVEKKEEKVDKK